MSKNNHDSILQKPECYPSALTGCYRPNASKHGVDEQTNMGFVQLYALSELRGDLTLTWEGKDDVEACGPDEGRKPAFPSIQQHQHQPCVHTRPLMRRRTSICKEKKRKRKKDYTFRRQCNEKPSVILGSPGPSCQMNGCAVLVAVSKD